MDCDPDSLKAVSLLPAAFRSVFSFRYFNTVQSECFAEAFLSDDNIVVAAPTGSGKTVVFELCILRLLSQRLASDGQFRHAHGTLKTVYVGPTKALVQEKLRDWKQKFGDLGLNCQELTGDVTDIKAIQDADIILATPEKFDSVTRRHKDHGGLSFFADVALFEIDEVHLLHESRGAALEAIVSRLKMLSRYPEMKDCALSKIRFVAVSATIPNVEDIGEWLKVPPRGVKRFGEEVRPVRLTTKVLGYAPAKNDFLFEKRLQSFLFDLIVQEASGKMVLVFCSTRKGAQDAAITLALAASKATRNPFIKNQEQFDRLQAAARSSKDKHLQDCIRCGVGFHNGGLEMVERTLVENLFLSGDMHVLCTTNTLAHGVNLPAHTVVIKSTHYYNKEKGCYAEYERSTLVQMCGRAGRPQFDDSGKVIIMTRRDTVHLYENLLSGSEVVESALLPAISEHLNAEIVLMTVSDVSLAIEWLKASYLYVRIKKNPQHYKIEVQASEDKLENHLKEICVRNLNALVAFGLVEMDEYGFLLKPLEPGQLMAKYYLNFETMKHITRAAVKISVEDMLYILANSQELSWIQLRRNEKKLLNDINTNTTGKIKYHVLGGNGKIKKRIQSPEEKIFVLLNDALSGELSTLDFSLSQDVTAICTNGVRIARCMSEYFKFVKRYKETLNALTLAKCIQQKLWDDSPYQLRQLLGVGMVTTKALLQAGINSFDKLANADPRRLESITGRRFPFGNQILEALDRLPPKVELTLKDTGRPVPGKVELTLTLTRLTNAGNLSSKSNVAHLLVGCEDTNYLHFYEKLRIEQFPSPYRVSLCIESTGKRGSCNVVAALVSESYVGVDIIEKLTVSCQTAKHRDRKCNSSSAISAGNHKEQAGTFNDKAINSGKGQLSRNRIFEHIHAKMHSFSSIAPSSYDGQGKRMHPVSGFDEMPSFTLFPEEANIEQGLLVDANDCGPEPEFQEEDPSSSIPSGQQALKRKRGDAFADDQAAQAQNCIPVFSASKLPRIQAFKPGSVVLKDGASLQEAATNHVGNSCASSCAQPRSVRLPEESVTSLCSTLFGAEDTDEGSIFSFL